MLYEINASAVWRPAKKKVIQHFSVSRLFGKNSKNVSEIADTLIYQTRTGFIYNNIYFLLGNLETSTSQEADSRAETGNTTTSLPSDMEAVKSGLRFWRTWIVVVVPLIALPILFQGRSQDSEEENEVNSILEFVSTHQGIRRKIYGRKMTRCDVNANGGSFTKEMSSESKVVQ